MKFLLEKSAEHLEKGLSLESDGKISQAHHKLLKAAEFLFKAAEKSEPSLKQQRVQRAESILKRAEALEKQIKQQEGRRATAEAESTGGASEWMVSEKPNVKLADIAGLEDAKDQIRIKMIYPFTHPEKAAKYGTKKGGGILLYGPPGTGKTMLAKAIAGEVDAAFYSIKPSQIMSKWVGEAEQNISGLFAEAKKNPRAVIFIDEVEALVPKRSGSHSTVMQRVVPQILGEMEGFSSGKQDESALLFLGATNEPWSLDEAIMRPGRFDEKIYVSLPNGKARTQIMKLHLKGRPLAGDVSLDDLAQVMKGYSGADIRRICEKACDIPFVESVKSGQDRDVAKQDFESVMKTIKPSVSIKALERFERFGIGK